MPDCRLKKCIYTKNRQMIEYVKGELADITPAFAVVDTGGVGYGLNISLNTYTAIQGRKEVRLYVFESIREDAYTLYGFASKQERDMFLMLISVSGVGANTARMILSELTSAELCEVIVSGNERVLKGVKGIGMRTAQRIIVDLKDKVAASGMAQDMPEGGMQAAQSINSEVRDEAVGALTMLGFAPAPTAKVVAAILKENPDTPVEQVVKLALKQIK